MTSLAFPKMFRANNIQVVKDHAAAMQNLELLLQSKIGEFFGDPEYGSQIVKALYQFNTTILVDILKDQIYTTICNYFPQLSLTRDDVVITRDTINLYVEITAFNDDTKTNNTFNISLMV